MIIDSDGHFFETEEIFDKYMEPALRNYRPRLLGDEQGHNFWVVDGQTSYKRPTIKGAGAPGTAAPPGKALQSARRASPGSQTLTNLKERLDDLDREKIDCSSSTRAFCSMPTPGRTVFWVTAFVALTTPGLTKPATKRRIV